MAITNIGNIQHHNVHTDQVLTELAVAFQYPELIGERIFTPVSVSKQKNEYPVFYPGEWNRLIDTARGPGGAYKQVEFSASKDNYHCNGNGLENGMPWEVRANADPWAQEYIEGGNIVSQLKRLVEVQQENRIATLLTTSANYASGFYDDRAGADQFNDAGIDGFEVLLGFIDSIALNTGGSRIKMVCTNDVWRNIQRDANFQPTFSDKIVTQKQALAEALEIDEIITVRAQYNSADKGQAESRTNIWGTNRIWLLTVAPPGAGDRTPATGRTFKWTDPSISAQNGEVTRVIDDERTQQTFIQYGKYYDVKLVGVDTSDNICTGCLLENVYQS